MEGDLLDIDRAFAEKVAQTIGGEITADRVSKFLEKASQIGLLVRGIKSRKRSEQAINEGVLPSAPDGGKMASWWALGKKIFAYPETVGIGRGFGLDTPFFSYGHWSKGTENESGYTLAVTTKDQVSPDSYFEGSEQAQITEPLDTSKIQFIILSKQLEKPEDRTREAGQACEQRAFVELEKIVNEGPQFGSVIRATI